MKKQLIHSILVVAALAVIFLGIPSYTQPSNRFEIYPMPSDRDGSMMPAVYWLDTKTGDVWFAETYEAMKEGSFTAKSETWEYLGGPRKIRKRIGDTGGY